MANGTVCKTVFCEFDSHRHLQITKASRNGGLCYFKALLESNDLRAPLQVAPPGLLFSSLSVSASPQNVTTSRFAALALSPSPSRGTGIASSNKTEEIPMAHPEKERLGCESCGAEIQFLKACKCSDEEQKKHSHVCCGREMRVIGQKTQKLEEAEKHKKAG